MACVRGQDRHERADLVVRAARTTAGSDLASISSSRSRSNGRGVDPADDAFLDVATQPCTASCGARAQLEAHSATTSMTRCGQRRAGVVEDRPHLGVAAGGAADQRLVVVRVLLDVVDERAAPPRSASTGGRRVRLGAPEQLLRGRPGDLQVEFLLGREVVEQQPARDPGLLAMSSTDSSSRVRVASISTPSAISWARRASGLSRTRFSLSCSADPTLLNVSQLAIDSRSMSG